MCQEYVGEAANTLVADDEISDFEDGFGRLDTLHTRVSKFRLCASSDQKSSMESCEIRVDYESDEIALRFYVGLLFDESIVCFGVHPIGQLEEGR